jgi:hypothetical protein
MALWMKRTSICNQRIFAKLNAMLNNDTGGLLLLFLWPAFEPPAPKRKTHPWRSEPAVKRGLSESRQVERTHLNAQKSWNLVSRKRR